MRRRSPPAGRRPRGRTAASSDRGASAAPARRRVRGRSAHRCSRVPLPGLRRDQTFELRNEAGNVPLHRVPHAHEVDIEIRVHEPLPHPDDTGPGRLGIWVPSVGAGVRGLLADGFHRLRYCEVPSTQNQRQSRKCLYLESSN